MKLSNVVNQVLKNVGYTNNDMVIISIGGGVMNP